MSVIIDKLSFSYGDKQVLRNINLGVQTGGVVGIIGVSGGGKSTLLKLISGLYDVQTGFISVMNECTFSGRRKHISMVLQSASLFPASIRDNITCGHDMTEKEIHNACEIAQLSEWIRSLPEGLDTFVGERGGKVSGGQAQRISIARAIAKNAPVILLDEPTSALDKDTGTAIIDILHKLSEGKTVIHVSHKPEMLIGCNRILQLNEGYLYD